MRSVFQLDEVRATGRTVTIAGTAAPGAGPYDLFDGIDTPTPQRLHRELPTSPSKTLTPSRSAPCPAELATLVIVLAHQRAIA
ncbi:hypothetical protein [Ilumatobacter sp.]|uniref:hypothetical protein n=1 Tax=Ilumatobacter sp. TaxID=1967498 RepID=UPI0037523DA2